MPILNSEDYESLATFRHLLRTFLRFSKDFLRHKASLSPEQYEALLAIKAFATPQGLTISQLSDCLQVKHHSAVNIVDRLVEQKLVTREASEADRRERHVNLTDRGKKLIEELATPHRNEMRNRSPEMIKALQRLRR